MKRLPLLVLCFLAACPAVNAQDRTLDEFKDYVNEKTNGQLDADTLDKIVGSVDKNSDGKISDDEFKARMAAFQAVLSERGRPDTPAKKPKEKLPQDADGKTPSASEVAQDNVTSVEPISNSPDATVLLITADELAAAWIPFAKWKTQNGKATKIVTISQIERDYQADSIQEKIRLCVRKHIDEANTLWVVLGGDCLPNGKGLVPGGHVTVHQQERQGIPTDIVYLSATNWDADGDGIYGEFEDDREAIQYPDGSVGLGRIPVRTADDIQAFTDKVIAYESAYPTTEFARNMIYTCTDSPAYPKVRNSWDGYVSKVWDGSAERFFSAETPWDSKDQKGDYDLSPSNMVKLFNQKRVGKLHIHGHGHLPAWVLENAQFSSKHLKQLENKNAYPLITTVSCNTGEYDSKNDPSIVEQMLRLPYAGSVAVVAPIRTGKPHFAKRSDFRLMVQEGKLDGTTLTMTRYWSLGLGGGNSTGHAIMKAKQAMAKDAVASAAYHLCVCELNLLGDPTLDMRAQTPRRPEVIVSNAKTINGKYQFDVKTKSPGATVCVWMGQDIYETKTADASGIASFSLKPVAGKAKVTVAGANLNSASIEMTIPTVK